MLSDRIDLVGDEVVCDLAGLVEVFSECGDAFMNISQSLQEIEGALSTGDFSVLHSEKWSTALTTSHGDGSQCDVIGSFLQSEKYWEEILVMSSKYASDPKGNSLKHSSIPLTVAPYFSDADSTAGDLHRMARVGFESFGACASAFESLQQAGKEIILHPIFPDDKMMDDVGIENNIIDFVAMDEFIQDESFWSDVLLMQYEKELVQTKFESLHVIEHQDEKLRVDTNIGKLLQSSEIPCHGGFPTDCLDGIKAADFANELLSVFDATGDAISELVNEQQQLLADLDSHVTYDSCDNRLCVEILSGTSEVGDVERLYQEESDQRTAVETVIQFVKADEFWSEVITMHEKDIISNPTRPQPSSSAKSGMTAEADAALSVDELLAPRIASISAPLDKASEMCTTPDNKENEDLLPGNATPRFSQIPRNVQEALRSSSLRDDLQVLCLKETPQALLTRNIDVANEAEEVTLQLIRKEMDRRSRLGPDVKSAASMFGIACATIALVTCTTSVYESPKLFRALWAAAFAINVVAVSMPGRLDRMYAEGNHVKPWQSLFEPCGWAFAIWGAIYLLELLLTMYVVLVGFPPHLFQVTMPYWLAGNWFQALWCFVFRAEFMKSLWVPSACLALAAIAFTGAHAMFSMYLARPGLSLEMQALLTVLRLPLALHSSWLVCGALINLNSWVAINVGRGSRGLQVMSAYSSAFLTALFGVTMSAYTRDPCFAATVAWALDALLARTTARAKEPKGMVSSDVQESLGALESMLSGGAKCVVIGVVLSSSLNMLS